MENGLNGSGQKSVAIEIAKPPAAMMDAYVPRSYDEAMRMATTLAKSGMTGALKSAEAVFLVLATGAEMGFTPTASLRGFFTFSGKVCPYADTIVAICLRSSVCEYFICAESTATSATFETKRKGSPKSISNTFTMAEAKAAGLDQKEVWKAYPKDMLRHRAAAPLARMVYPDLILNLHSIEEMRDATQAPAPAAEPVRQQEVLDAEVVAAPAYDDSLVRLTRAYEEAKTMDEIKAIRVEVLGLKFEKDSDDFKGLKALDKEASERVKAAGEAVIQ